ncbi:hypothetical protein BY458DRAFT_519559 [Sporodiniella umbellata]|nr:hypothetical protein BY458DRAFT_519559 [Sporodiniella umbellata]
MTNDLITQLLSLPVDFPMEPLPMPAVVAPKKSRVSLEEKDQKTKERILRNRAAAQESRDKKRRYVTDLETKNKQLEQENDQAKKKMRTLEDQNKWLASQLEAISQHCVALQSQMKFSTPFLLNDFCDSARIVKKALREWFL